MVVGDPDLDLVRARAEARAVAALLPGASLLLGQQATRSELLAALPGASLLHFAGHGKLRADSPWEAHLSLAAADRLTLADLLVSRPEVGLVVLNGCETGRRLTLSRHETIGLPEAFLAAGARSVVASDRPLRDDEASEFVRRFYLRGGVHKPGAALRATALDFRRRGSAIWDAFRLSGRP